MFGQLFDGFLSVGDPLFQNYLILRENVDLILVLDHEPICQNPPSVRSAQVVRTAQLCKLTHIDALLELDRDFPAGLTVPPFRLFHGDAENIAHSGKP